MGDAISYVISLDESSEYLGNTYVGKYIHRYAKTIGCTHVVYEPIYTDKEYLLDYQNYYSRSHREHPRTTQRLHFLKLDKPLSNDDVMGLLIDGKIGALLTTKDSYCGFTVIKPITTAEGEPIIGRTMLATYEKEAIDSEGQKIVRYYLENTHKSHLFGNEMSIKSTPFQAQDKEVSACATVALWTACQALTSEFGTQTHALSEIAAKTAIRPATSRSFPTSGLTLPQIVEYIHSIGLETDLIHVSNEDNDASTDQSNVRDAKTAIKAFIRAGMPIIAMIALIKEPETEDEKKEKAYHAVVITGYGENENGDLVELYLHDDGIGPYCRARWKENVPEIKYEWNDPDMRAEYPCFHFDKIIIHTLVTPVYPKFRMPSSQIIFNYWQYINDHQDSETLDFQLLFFLAKDYKRDLIRNGCKYRERFLTENLPRFLAVIRIMKKGKIALDLVHDATESLPRIPELVHYRDLKPKPVKIDLSGSPLATTL